MPEEFLTWSDPAVTGAVRATIAADAEASTTEPDDGFDAHAAYADDTRAGVRESLSMIEAKLMGVREDIGQLDEIDCGGDCCGSSSDRKYALDFIEQAERAAAAARGLMRHAWRGDGA